MEKHVNNIISFQSQHCASFDNSGLASVHGDFMMLYGGLPKPATHIYERLKVFQVGSAVEAILTFLELCFDIQRVIHLPDDLFLQTLLPFCKGIFGEILNNVLKNKGNFESFHEDIVVTFTSSRVFFDVLQNIFYRSQGINEYIVYYVHSIHVMAKILRLNKNEIVGTILDGLNPLERLRLLFLEKPCSFAELNLLCIKSHNKHKIDDHCSSNLSEVKKGYYIIKTISKFFFSWALNH